MSVIALTGLVLAFIIFPMILMALVFTGKIGTPQEKRGSEYYEERAENYWRSKNG
jgi:hypothetical protein